MKLSNYKKVINVHAIISLAIGVASLACSVMTQFFDIMFHPLGSAQTQMLWSVAAVAIAMIQYLYTKNILKKRVLSVAYNDTLEEKTTAYMRLMLQSFYFSAFALTAITAICIFVDNSLLLCLELIVLVFSIMLLKPSAYRMKVDLQLSDDDVAKIYGDNWDKKQKLT